MGKKSLARELDELTLRVSTLAQSQHHAWRVGREMLALDQVKQLARTTRELGEIVDDLQALLESAGANRHQSPASPAAAVG